MQVPTVHIKHPDLPDGALINASDFDPAVHKLFDAPAPAGKARAKAADAKADTSEAGSEQAVSAPQD